MMELERLIPAAKEWQSEAVALYVVISSHTAACDCDCANPQSSYSRSILQLSDPELQIGFRFRGTAEQRSIHR